MPLPAAESSPSSGVEIIAHRGASHDAPENTIAAVQCAWSLGADAVEIDCRLTRDEQIAVIHDPDTRRTAGQAFLVAEHSLAKLQTLDVGVWKSQEFQRERIPTLSEVIATLPVAKRLFIEVKCGPEINPHLGKVLSNSRKTLDQFVVVSYHQQVLTEIKQQLPEITALLVARFERDAATSKLLPTIDHLADIARNNGLDGLDLHAEGPFDEQTAELLVAHKLQFYVWTVDAPDKAKRLIELGVSGITTNRPGWLRRQLRLATEKKGAEK